MVAFSVMTGKTLAPIVRIELWQNQRDIPTIGNRLSYQSRKMRGGAVQSAINNVLDPVNKAA